MINKNFITKKMNVFRFFKFIDVDNYRSWKKNMQMTSMFANLWKLFDDSYKRFDIVFENELTKFTRTKKKNYQHDVMIWNTKNQNFVEKIVVMCIDVIVQQVDLTMSVKTLWNHLIERYQFIDWINKWAIMNRFEQLNYDDFKNVFTFDFKFMILIKKIKNFKINMKNWFVIKIFNSFESNFDTIIVIINVEIHKDEKFFTLFNLIERFEREKNRINNQKINFFRHTKQKKRIQNRKTHEKNHNFDIENVNKNVDDKKKLV